MTKKYDAIVIGAGHNGLTNGAYLAKAGLNVLMVEKNDFIGGATVSRELYKTTGNTPTAPTCAACCAPRSTAA